MINKEFTNILLAFKPTAALYLETGCIPVRYILKKRRLMYLHHILTRNSNELIRRVYEAQKSAPVKDDWILQVKEDLKEFKIDIDIVLITSCCAAEIHLCLDISNILKCLKDK